MQFENFSFGSLRIDGKTYEHDVVIDRGEIHKREKKPSKRCRDDFGHTPLSIEEKSPVEMSSARDRQRGARQSTGEGRSATRGKAPQD